METEILGYTALTSALIAVAVEVVHQIHKEYRRHHEQQALQAHIINTTNELLDQARQLNQQARAHMSEANAPVNPFVYRPLTYQDVEFIGDQTTITKRFYDLEAENYPNHQYNDALPKHPTRPPTCPPTRPFTDGDYDPYNNYPN